MDRSRTVREIAVEYPFSISVVKRVLREEEVQLRSRGSRRREKCQKHRKDIWKHADRIVQLYTDAKKSPRRIAAEFRCSTEPILDILKVKGVKMRSLKESRRYRPDKYGYAEHQQVEVKRKRWQPKVTVNRKMSVQALRDKDLTIDEIADITGMSRIDVFQELQQ